MVDQVPDVQRSWIKKLFGFTVLKPTERSTTTLGSQMLTLYVPGLFILLCLTVGRLSDVHVFTKSVLFAV